MSSEKRIDKETQKVLDALNKHGDIREAAAELNLSYNQLNYRILSMSLRKVTRWERRK